MDNRETPKAILLDLDDTLIDKAASLRRCAHTFFERFELGSHTDRETFTDLMVEQHSIIQPKPEAFFTIGRTLGLTESLTARLAATFDRDFPLYNRPFDGAIPQLKTWRAMGIRLACVTNGRDFFQRAKIRAIDAEPLLDAIVTSGEAGVKKPDPAIFESALERLGVSAQDTLMIGDNARADILPAQQLGMATRHKLAQAPSSPPADNAFVDWRDLTLSQESHP